MNAVFFVRWCRGIAFSTTVVVVTTCISLSLLAAPLDGVRCPNGFEAQYDSASKTLRCQRSLALHRPAVCDPKFPDYVVYRAGKGRDSCVRIGDANASTRTERDSDGRGRAVTCTIDSNDKHDWQIDIDPNAQERDRCRANNVEWIYPSQQ
jgi:hypothetical protein